MKSVKSGLRPARILLGLCAGLWLLACNFSFGDKNAEGSPAWHSWDSKLRESPWLTAIGSDYIELAFKAAREADPDAKLYYNDYSLDNQNKAAAVYEMVRDINRRFPNVGGRPLIDGIGMQAHYGIWTDPGNVEKSIQLFSSLGVEVSISELDIQAGTNGQFESGWENQQAELYAKLFRIFKQNASHISRVTFWGLNDGKSWRSTSKPLLFDKDYKSKPAFYAVENPDLSSFPAEGEVMSGLSPLHEKYDSSFLLGNIVSPGDIGKTDFSNLSRHFTAATAENDMKPENIQRTKGNFTYPDTMVKAVLDAGMKMHAHTLVWHQQTPSWMNTGNNMTRETALENMTTHITTVVAHFKGKVISWDVVNEAIKDGL
ncbi:MAG: endo-1,4-beta-xylanase [Treponema sp.]|jgi:GH35 family endo-1,4-beta-xylanase|nr:endo-1,4-beta-xylanase [Treponema sp.]